AARVAEVEMARQDAAAAVERDDRVLDVDVVDAVRELADELDGIDPLPNEMARIEIEAEFLAVADRIEGAAGGVDVEGEFGRVDFEGEADAAFGEDVEDRVPAIGELLEAGFDHRLGHWRERVGEVPDAGAGEAVDDANAELLRGAGGRLHFLGGALVDAIGLAVAPDVGRQDRLMAFVDDVADRLANEVIADRVALQAVAIELFAFGGA